MKQFFISICILFITKKNLPRHLIVCDQHVYKEFEGDTGTCDDDGQAVSQLCKKKKLQKYIHRKDNFVAIQIEKHIGDISEFRSGSLNACA